MDKLNKNNDKLANNFAYKPVEKENNSKDLNNGSNDIGKGKKVKTKKTAGDKMATFTLVIEILIALGLFGLALAPMMSAFFAICLFFFIVVGVIVTTVVTLGTAWTSSGFKKFWADAWEFMKKSFDSGATIKDSLKGSIIWLSIVMFVLSSVGFIYNLIYYIKTKKNKKRFIASCVFLAFSLIGMATAMGVYLTK